MKTYLVGGAVRDALMGLPVRDRDWVVVGATPQQMLDLGYTQVGRDFPVFLHPKTKDEYALARTERNTGPGYRGFAVQAGPGVTLEEDLARRDLTINAIALTANHDLPHAPLREADLVDPFHGQRDIANRVLRHVTPAFCEDPVRILRLARFAARFQDYSVAPETMALMRTMVDAGDVDHLVAERVWQELARGLMEHQPTRMFAVLRECGALKHLLPELDALWGVPQSPDHHPEIDTGVHTMQVLEVAARMRSSMPVRFACLMHDLGKGVTPPEMLPRHPDHEARGLPMLRSITQRLRVPTECSELAEVVMREHGHIHRSTALEPDGVLDLLERCDAIRKPARFAEILLACECDSRGRTGMQDAPYPQRPRLAAALDKVLALPTEAIARKAMEDGAKGPKIGEVIRQARLRLLEQNLQ